MQDFAVARRAMIDSQLRPQAVTHRAVLEAMGTVPRETFVPEAARAFAYVDRSIPLDGGRSMMPPAALGQLLDALDPRPGQRALVVDPASGYPAAVLVATGVAVDQGDGSGTYDLILVDGAVEELPAALIERLSPTGRIGAAMSERGVTRLAVGNRVGDRISWRSIADADVAPIARFQRPPAFTF